MRAHLVQFDIVWEDRDANFARVEGMLRDASVEAGDLVVLPEMFDSGFSLNIERTADRESRTLAWLEEVARSYRAVVQGGRTIIPPGSEKAENRAPVLGPQGELLCEYAKIHPFNFGREGERFTGGSTICLYAWGADRPLRVAPAICYDLRFPELFRLAMLEGAQAFAIGANWPRPRQNHWRQLLIGRAIENQAYVLGVNRTGADPHLKYAGGTIAVDPRGEIIGELGAEEAILSVEVDPDRVQRWRESFRVLEDIRLLGLPSGPRGGKIQRA